MSKLPSVCCREMILSLKDKEHPIYYDLVLREYYIKTYHKYSILIIKYCPWCRTELPKELRDEFFDILDHEYNIDTNIGDYKTNSQIPPEFKSDEWWKKRGL